MTTIERERNSQRKLVLLVVLLIVAYGTAKYQHVTTALQAYEGQALLQDTTGAAK
ncbi:hypothetical protein RUESEDTHA_04167 [Ruegeria sp. THAF57]|uniref:hypothetical protein n=1 Tax=Ruegeria sp. THAF57 TaxID=2744555 RepID=UPI0015DE6BC0|nr:hypothetical protein [Ruegeria sp. THAF57]CAD0187255.1 hypothetical protein RUESEDTHA_04167 [Ruegeria sp. THAF57]